MAKFLNANLANTCTCPICRNLTQNAAILHGEHLFCEPCIRNHISITRDHHNETFKCPMCNRICTEMDLSTQCGIIERIIGECLVYCGAPYTDDVENNDAENNDEKSLCSWSGTFSEYSKHQEICPYQQVECPYHKLQGETVTIFRIDLDDHQKECQWFPIKCKYCELNVVRCQMQHHINTNCKKAIIKCANANCSEIIERQNLAQHNEECPESTVSCDYKKYGCNNTFKRKHSRKHEQNNMNKHLKLVLNMLKQLELKFELLQDQMAAM